jgi:non-specific serine/threonine protein kinase/serine/threonine-protein kinase
VETWLDRALDQPAAGRTAWLQAQPLPPALREEVLALLQAEAASGALFPGLGDGGSALQAGERIGAWRVEALIGRGGSGEVYRVARADGAYEQQAALKLLRCPDDPDERQRFAAERRLLARLQSPAIVRLLDGGAHQGRLYAVTELVQGRPLDEQAAGQPLAQRLALLQRVVEAVAQAHRAAVVHRDLKPANILVDAQGAPRLLDFGIARLAEGKADAGSTLALRFTPDYCAPEQLQALPVTAAADVYALGVIAWQLLTGALPWALQGNGVQRALQRLAQPAPAAGPSRRLSGADAARVRGDLDAIVLRCLQPQPADRYAHADALLEDLQRWREGRPVQARGDAPGYLLGRLLRRHRLAVGAAAAVLLSLLLGLAGTAWQAREASRERDMARAEAAANKAVRDVLLSMFRIAGEQGSGADAPTARQLLAQSAQRLQQQLQDDPAAAETLLALAQLYFQLNDYVGAQPLFESLLAQATRLPPDTVAQARMDLAQCLWRAGQTQRAAELLQQAQAFWQAEPARWRNRLIETRLVQAQVARAQGRHDEAIALLLQARDERVALLGLQHAETAIVISNLGTARFHAGQLDAARADFEQAWGLWQALRAEHGADGLNTLNNWAALELRQGRMERAEELFRRALALRQAHLPPSSAQAALMNNLGKLMLRRGDAAGAAPLLAEAVAMATRYAGPASPHALAALAGQAEAQTALGQDAEATRTLQDLERRTATLANPDDPQRGLADLAWARWLATRGDTAQARARLAAAQALWQGLGPAGAPYLAQSRALEAGWAPSAAGGPAAAGAGAGTGGAAATGGAPAVAR